MNIEVLTFFVPPDVYFSTYDYGLAGSLDGYTTPKPDVWTG